MTTKDIDAHYVPIADVGSRLGIDPAHLLSQLDGEVQTDWAQRPCIPASRARQIVAAFEADRQKMEAWHRGRDDYERRRQAKRGEVYQRALERAAAEARRQFDRGLAVEGTQDLDRQALPPPLQQEVWRRANDALARWDAAHPAPEDAVDYGTRREYYERMLEKD